MRRVFTILMLLMPNALWASEPVSEGLNRADNTFMMICTVLVLFMSIPGIALFYSGLLRSKNVLSMLSQVLVVFSLITVLWIVYGYSLTFSYGGWFFGNFDALLLSNVTPTSVHNTIYEFIWIVFQGSFACLTCCLILGSFAERIRFSAVLIFMVIWFTLSYIPMAHMVWGGGILSDEGTLDFAGGTVVHINAAVSALIGAYFINKRIGFNKESLRPSNLPNVYLGSAILFIGWFGFNAGSAGEADEIAALAFINTFVAMGAAVLGWSAVEWFHRGKPSCLGACSGIVAGLVGITPAAGFVGVGGAIIIGLVCGGIGVWGVSVLKRVLRVDDTCDVFGIHGVCGIVGCILTGVFASTSLGGVGYADNMTMLSQVWVQFFSVVTCVIWTIVVSLIGYKTADLLVGLRVSQEHERQGLDINSHGESAYSD